MTDRLITKILMPTGTTTFTPAMQREWEKLCECGFRKICFEGRIICAECNPPDGYVSPWKGAKGEPS